MDKKLLKSLLVKYNTGTITAEEKLALKNFLNTEEGSRLAFKVWDEEFEPLYWDENRLDRADAVFQRILNDTRLADMPFDRQPIWPINKSWARVAIAASVVLALSIGLTYYFSNHLFDQTRFARTVNREIKPGSDKARILFEDNTFIELDELKGDTLLKDKNLRVFKREDGTIAYELAGPSVNKTQVYNTIVTPKGGEYSLVLPDGSQVWINAASRLKYPLTFQEQLREVQLDGEAYFEIKKQFKEGKRIPFIVHTSDQKLVVLGTSFNIKSYDENIITTLVEGSVSLSYENGEGLKYLKPSQQSNYSRADRNLSVKTVDPYYSIAWKNGSFAFENATIYQVMDDVARWYDIEVEYEGDLSQIRYSGKISRFENFKQLLQLIEWTGLVTFKVQGRRVTVMK